MECGYGEKLILHFYGEAGEALKAEMEAHLGSCASCREALRALAAAEGLLNQAPPLPSAAALGAVMAQARAAAAGRRKPFLWWGRVETAFAGAMAAALIAVFAFAPHGTSPELAWNSGVDSTLDSVEYSIYQTQSDLTASSGDWDYSYGLLKAEGQSLEAGGVSES